MRREHRLAPWVRGGLALVFAQILLGGLQRHYGGAVSCLDFPLCDGSLWPVGAPLALKLHMAHRILGFAVGAYILGLAVALWRTSSDWNVMRGLAVTSVALVAWQITLGALTILTVRSVAVSNLHFTGAVGLWLTFVTMFLLTRSSSSARDDMATWAAPSKA
jgi:cytochrome c oxidase assembly protein subunit 15